MKFLIILLTLGVALAGSIADNPEKQDGRIVGGDDYNIQRSLVSIQLNDHICGGVIVKPHWVLTAAHCVSGLAPNLLRVRYNSVTSSWGGTLVKVQRIVIHPSFAPHTASQMANDLALVNTEQMESFSCLTVASSYAISKRLLNVHGWGTGGENSGQSEMRQQMVEQPATYANYQADCVRNYASVNITIDPTTTLCVGDIDRSGKGICHGDGGVPAIEPIYDQVFGIGSFSYGCGKAGFPGVFTAVGKYYNWIRDTTTATAE